MIPTSPCAPLFPNRWTSNVTPCWRLSPDKELPSVLMCSQPPLQNLHQMSLNSWTPSLLTSWSLWSQLTLRYVGPLLLAFRSVRFSVLCVISLFFVKQKHLIFLYFFCVYMYVIWSWRMKCLTKHSFTGERVLHQLLQSPQVWQPCRALNWPSMWGEVVTWEWGQTDRGIQPFGMDTHLLPHCQLPPTAIPHHLCTILKSSLVHQLSFPSAILVP